METINVTRDDLGPARAEDVAGDSELYAMEEPAPSWDRFEQPASARDVVEESLPARDSLEQPTSVRNSVEGYAPARDVLKEPGKLEDDQAEKKPEPTSTATPIPLPPPLDFRSPAYTNFKSSIAASLKRLKVSLEREMALEARVKGFDAERRRAEADRATLKRRMEKEEEEALERLRIVEREAFRRQEEANALIGKLDNDLAILREMNEELTKDSEMIKSRVADTKNRLSEREAQLEDALRSKEALEKRAASNEESLRESRKEEESLRLRTKEIMTKLVETEKNLRFKDEELKSCLRTRDELGDEIEDLRRKLIEAEAKSSSPKDEARAKTARWQRDELDALEEEVKKLKSEKRQAQKEFEKLGLCVGDLSETVSLQNRVNSEMSKKLDANRVAIKELQSEMQVCKEKLQVAKDKLVAKEAELTREQAEWNERYEEYKQSIHELSAQKDKLVNDIESLTQETTRIKKALDESKRSHEETRFLLKRCEEKYETESRDWKDKEDCFSAQLAETNELKRHLEELQLVNETHFQTIGSVFKNANRVKNGAEADKGGKEEEMKVSVACETEVNGTSAETGIAEIIQ